jgi:hypothetical protein
MLVHSARTFFLTDQFNFCTVLSAESYDRRADQRLPRNMTPGPESGMMAFIKPSIEMRAEI